MWRSKGGKPRPTDVGAGSRLFRILLLLFCVKTTWLADYFVSLHTVITKEIWTKKTFQDLLTKEVESYKSLLETKDNDWIVKGFIDVNKNVYTITNDTKVVSKIIEIILIPHLDAFARRNGMTMELPSKQNYYPDLTFKDADGNLFAVDFKLSYYGDDRKVNGLTLGSYWGYFRNRDVKKSTDHPYNDYKVTSSSACSTSRA